MNKTINSAIIASLAAVMPIGAASAAIIETLEIESSGFFNGQSFSTDNLTDFVEGDNGFQRNGVALTSYVDGGNFFFHHNISSQGGGFVQMSTLLSITLTNTGNSTAFLRFDSMITPGHIALQGITAGNLAFFTFSVRQQLNPQNIVELYQAQGYLDTDSFQDEYVRTTEGGLRNFSEHRSEGRVGFDWDATPLSLALRPILPGQTHVISYFNSTFASSAGVCVTPLGCEGTQVAFGDPRNDGSTSQRSDNVSLASTTESFIGRTFGSFSQAVPQIVSVAEPLPPEPESYLVPTDYDSLPVVDAVPEPSNWLMLITGFGLVGAQTRRRRLQPA